jgi:microcystin-dependent protein
MHRVDTSQAAVARPANGAAGPVPDGYFQPGDPTSGPTATVPGYGWFNSVQEEIAYVIEQNGLALDKADDTLLHAAIAAQIAAAVAASLTPTGFLQPAFRAAAPAGWLLLNGDTIGSAASAAVHNDAGLEALYTVLWDNLADAEAAVSGGRGANAAADWAANKTLTLPDSRGRAIIGAGTGAGLTARTLGDATIGEEDQTLTAGQLAAHTHPYPHGEGPGDGTSTQETANNQGNYDTGSAGGDEAHNNMQPSLVANWMIKT